MNSELYKAKSIEMNTWIIGYLYRISEKAIPFIMTRNSGGLSYEVEEETICRCVDKEYMDGEMAFQGDIFESQSTGTRMVLKYGTYESYCQVDRTVMDSVGFYAEADGYPAMPIGDLSDYALKIGNIFDNADLLNY